MAKEPFWKTLPKRCQNFAIKFWQVRNQPCLAGLRLHPSGEHGRQDALHHAGLGHHHGPGGRLFCFNAPRERGRVEGEEGSSGLFIPPSICRISWTFSPNFFRGAEKQSHEEREDERENKHSFVDIFTEFCRTCGKP